MSQADDESMLETQVRTMQIIVGMLVWGPVFFLGVILFLRSHPKPAPGPAPARAQSAPVISYAAVAFALAAVPMSLRIPAVVIKNGRRQIAAGTWTPPSRGDRAYPPGPFGDTYRLASLYQTALILGAALNEGAAFFALIAYLIEGAPAALLLAGVLILGVALRFPSRARFRRWIDAQKELLIEERQALG